LKEEESIPKLSQARVDDFLRKRYRYGVLEFSKSLYVIASFVKAYQNKKLTKDFKLAINNLVNLKSNLLENLKIVIEDCGYVNLTEDFFKKHEIPADKKNDTAFLTKFFKLEHTFKIIDSKIAHLKKNIAFLEKFGYKSRIKDMRIVPINLVVLVWGQAMGLDKGGSHKKDFLIIANLIRWFQDHTDWDKFYKWPSRFSNDTVRLTFFKYIKYRNRKDKRRKFYVYLTEWLRLNCFSEELEAIHSDLFPKKPEIEASLEKGIFEPSEYLLSEQDFTAI